MSITAAMRPLILDPDTLAAIKAAVERARAKPIPWETLRRHVPQQRESKRKLTLADRGDDRDWRPPSEQVLIAHGFRAAISFEEQPAGLIRHLSVSVDTPGRTPSMEAMALLAIAFGFRSFPVRMEQVWLEEFEPGHHAVNVVEIERERAQQGGVQ